MREFSIDLAAEQISDQRTKDYFQEVLGSFINGNYRSAVVMLWSVVVADFVYKLQALRDLYQDATAISILDAIEAKQVANPTSPEWEPFLLEEINSRTHLLEAADYQHLVNLQKLRHLSAHPVLSGSHLLFAPNKETTRSLIRNALEAVLLKPPIFSKKIVGEFVSDIAAKKELLPDQKALKQYLNAKYFGNLHASVEQELLKALWKFCFRVSNPDADANRSINTRALYLLYERHPTELRQFIVQNAVYFSEVAPNGAPLTALIEFLSDCPALFGALTDAARVPLTTFANTHVNLLAPSSFISPSFSDHIATVSSLPYAQLRELSDENWKKLIAKGAETGQVQQVYGLGTKIYCGSLAFGSADSHFARFISPHIAEFDSERLNQILVGIEGNNQTYWRGRARIDHPRIAERVAVVGNIDLAAYPHFTGSLPTTE
ncbi:MAG: hypothetical protein IPH35_01350 [Rhodoferax sp.]|nr:hypothetical protein [Rhodoferax sp.]